MRKTVGPIVVIDTSPPHRPWDGNQATYLFFPTFIAFLLVLVSYLSSPLIHGLSVVDVATANGTVSLGVWGWCATDLAGGAGSRCSAHRPFGASMEPTLAQLPDSLRALAEIASALPTSYVVANVVFHLLSCIALWITTCWTLAAAGQWDKKQQNAWDWTRWAFAGTFWSSIFILIAWGLDLGFVTNVKSSAVNADGTKPHVAPGPAIWMMMVGWLLMGVSFAVRTTYLKYRPRPQWTLKDASDFHDPTRPPLGSAALPPQDEQPPTWESLNIDTPIPVDEKEAVREPQAV